MGEATNQLESATIKYDGAVREAGSDGAPIEVFVVEMPQRSFWFETSYKYADNEHDFWVTVWNFGLHRRTAAGSRTPLVRDTFTASDAATARARLEALFLGRKDTAALPYVPFRMAQTKCLGVNFPDGWITVV